MQLVSSFMQMLVFMRDVQTFACIYTQLFFVISDAICLAAFLSDVFITLFNELCRAYE